MAEVPDLTLVYYTANVIPGGFAASAQRQLSESKGDLPLISVSHEPIDMEGFGENIVVDLARSHFNIYRQALIGAKAAKTKYIALCEDDVLYSPEHFKYRPTPGYFAYNMNSWMIYTWVKPAMFTMKPNGRKNLNGLICERELFIEAMEERFAKHPDDSKTDKTIWAEPGKYEGYLQVTKRNTEEFHINPPNVIFTHENELSFAGLGYRKRVGQIRALKIPYWGEAEEARKLYGED